MADPDAPRPSLAEFTHEVEAAIREAGYLGAFTRDEAQGLIGIEGGGWLRGSGLALPPGDHSCLASMHFALRGAGLPLDRAYGAP